MSGLLFLTSDDFAVQRGAKGPILCHNIRGFSLILFYSTHCSYCNDLIPIFKKLPGSIDGCQFGMINVSSNRTCVEMSQNTIAPIKYVPFIILYVDGQPLMIYKGPSNEEDIRKFIVEVASNVGRKQQFSSSNNAKIKEDPESGIPAYTVGKPISGDLRDSRCYLNFTTAYNSEQKTMNNPMLPPRER